MKKESAKVKSGGYPSKDRKGKDTDFKDLSPEIIEKAKACTSPEELENLAKGENLELSLDELDSASGGTGDCLYDCM